MNCSFCHNHNMFYSRLGHKHDDRYYTEGEVDGLIEAIELTPGPQGDPGPQGPQGATGPQPPMATQSEVDTGTVTDKAVAPSTLKSYIETVDTAKVSKLYESDGGGPAVIVDSEGRVGVGLTPGYYKLDISGGIRTGGSLAAIVIEARDGSGSTFTFYNPTGDYMQLDVSNVGTVFRVDPSGNAWFAANCSALSFTDRP